jgi:hypothetical protein
MRSFVTDPIIPISSQAGLYYRVVDANNCSVTLPKVTITAFSKPEYTVTKTDSKCYGEKAIQFNVTKANGYTLQYSI